MKKFFKKSVAVLLMLAMFLTTFPASATAAKAKNGADQWYSNFRINCGGGEMTLNGEVWSADQKYQEGSWGYSGTDRNDIYANNGTIRNAADKDVLRNPEMAQLFKTLRYYFPAGVRAGYTFDNLKAGEYQVDLYFTSLPNDNRVFDIELQGEVVADNYAITGANPGSNAKKESFTAAVGSDGKLELNMVSSIDCPAIYAIEVFSHEEDPSKPKDPEGTVNECYVLCGARGSHKDKDGNEWGVDQPYVNGSWGYDSTKETATYDGKAVNVPDDEKFLYQRMRYSYPGKATVLEYQFDHLATGRYEVTLYFTELNGYGFGSKERPMNIYVQNQLMEADYNIADVAGGTECGCSESFVVDAVYGSGLNLKFEQVGPESALVTAIKIVPTTAELSKPILAAPTADPEGGRVAAEQKITLSSIEGAKIYYTLDGSNPQDETNVNRRLYTEAFTLNGMKGKVILKAAAEHKNYKRSPVKSYEFKIINTPEAAEGSGIPGRVTVDGEKLMNGWKLWYDEKAEYWNDTLYLPSETDIAYLAENDSKVPTGGWDALDTADSIDVNLPATVEEFYTKTGLVNAPGQKQTGCDGVSWFWKDVEIPSEWKGKTVMLDIAAAGIRTEVYANETLVGYNLVTDTPYACDLSKALEYGKTNRIAIRITNPGSHHGYADFPCVTWGNYQLAPAHGFGGIFGDVILTARNNTYVDDVYVKNENTEDCRTISVQTTIHNRQSEEIQGSLKYEIVSVKDGRVIQTAEKPVTVAPYTPSPEGYKATVVTQEIACSDAELWNVDTPNLYTCRVTLTDIDTEDAQTIEDTHETRFGFRVFEVKKSEQDCRDHFYINGKRFVMKSAIDWSFYALTGAYPTGEMAEKSVQTAKDIGQNAIFLHRQVGNATMMDYADELGLFLQEEPGGFHRNQGGNVAPPGSWSAILLEEKLIRMVKRDRSRPSVVMYDLCNEDEGYWDETRQRLLPKVHEMDAE